jgi:hypothetical protein
VYKEYAFIDHITGRSGRRRRRRRRRKKREACKKEEERKLNNLSSDSRQIITKYTKKLSFWDLFTVAELVIPKFYAPKSYVYDLIVKITFAKFLDLCSSHRSSKSGELVLHKAFPSLEAVDCNSGNPKSVIDNLSICWRDEDPNNN